ncbi:MAG: YcxB family protein [Lachnospiraceae bacterium]|nr:YcxB family protein [Lachnospiraceae bacterium]
MKVEFDVKMTVPVMYDYMMYHTVTGVQFWLVVAIAVMLGCVYPYSKNPLYILAAVVVLVYLPIERYIQAKKQVALNPVFKETLHYTVDEEKMSVDVLEEHMDARLDSIAKVRSTKKSLILYTNRITATIFPKEAMGEDYDKVVKLIRQGVPAERVKIK